MVSQRVTIPKGMRDFSPAEMARRNHIFSTIKSAFSLFGYLPIETPSMEQLSTLLGKYGDEGDKLLFRVLNSGDFLKRLPPESRIEDLKLDDAARALCEKGMRYDLTVPFARYVSQNWHELPRPFKRYQIQPVWRADRPQRGRYREFYQCDIDVVGSDSLLCEVELIEVVEKVFRDLGLRAEIRINNRKILSALAEIIGHSDLLIPITVAIDKLEKVGIDAVQDEWRSVGVDEEGIEVLTKAIDAQGSNTERIEALRHVLEGSRLGECGLKELEDVLSRVDSLNLTIPVIADLSLARGLNYYTGAIFEVKALDVEIGSICGGGRYDNLTGVFGLEGVSGVGISFGADRIYDAMLELELFPINITSALDVLVLNMGEETLSASLEVTRKLRENGIRTMLYPDNAKFKKQMSFANSISLPWVVIVGPDELANGNVAIKNMRSGEQIVRPLENAPNWLTDVILH